MQEILTGLVLLAAVGYLVWRHRKGKATGNCCGQAECPAAKQTLRALERAKR